MTSLKDSDRVNVLLEARTKYRDSDSADKYDEVLSEVTGRVDECGSIGKADIGALVFWKRLRADARWVPKLMATPESTVRAITAPAVRMARDPALSLSDAAGRARRQLLPLDGCKSGAAIPSAMLLAAAPERMAVYDRRAQLALDTKLHLGIDSKQHGFYGGYMAVVERLMDEVNSSRHPTRSWIPRDVDLALYMLGARRTVTT